LTNIEWTSENVDKLMACQTTADFQSAFPGRNVETLKRRQREFRAAMPDMVRPFTEDVPDAEGDITLVGDSGVINTGTVETPITDWSDTLAVWGLDPEVFEVIEPVTMKAWDSGSGRKFSYRANIRRKTVSQDVEDKLDIDGWRETLRSLTLNPSTRLREGGATYTILVADPQLGKPGTQEAVTSWRDGIEGHLERIYNLRNSGIPVDGIALAFMGDEHEGAVGNYASQPYEVELNYSEQIELDFDMRVWSIRQLLNTGLSIQIASVPSNHGEHTRFGSSHALTSIYDNSSTMVAALAKKVFDGTDASDFLTWEIARDRQDANLNLSGIKANFTHGHVGKASGSPTGGIRSKNVIEKQILGRTSELVDHSVFFSAHYHHFNVIEDRGRTYFGCPALEAEKSSQWFYDSSGVWSRPGMLGLLVGKACGDRGWDELAVI
jgi:hypothetical protein